MGKAEIKATLERCINTSYNRQDIQRLIDLCHRYALSYLKMKSSSCKLYFLSDENTDDLAWDCIADLFERNNQNRYIQFENYFGGDELETLSEFEIRIKLRRLVFSKVNDGLFRNFGIYDMSLSKIIRNLKLAAGQHNLPVDREGNDNYLFFIRDNKESLTLPLMPPEFLEIRLTHRLQVKMDTPEILGILMEIFNNQKQYQKRYPLVQVANIIRKSFINLHDQQKSFRNPDSPVVRKEKIDEFLQSSLRHCRQCFEKSYVYSGKIEKEALEKYLACIENILHHHYISDSELGDSYFNHFNKVYPDITKDEYRQNHRQYLEYMVKLVREDLFHKIRKVI